MDRIAESHPKNNGDHFAGEMLALFGDHFFCGRLTFIFFLILGISGV